MVLKGAELLLFPSMMGEFEDDLETKSLSRNDKEHWQRVMQGQYVGVSFQH